MSGGSSSVKKAMALAKLEKPKLVSCGARKRERSVMVTGGAGVNLFTTSTWMPSFEATLLMTSGDMASLPPALFTATAADAVLLPGGLGAREAPANVTIILYKCSFVKQDMMTRAENDRVKQITEITNRSRFAESYFVLRVVAASVPGKCSTTSHLLLPSLSWSTSTRSVVSECYPLPGQKETNQIQLINQWPLIKKSINRR